MTVPTKLLAEAERLGSDAQLKAPRLSLAATTAVAARPAGQVDGRRPAAPHRDLASTAL
ncbi:hypothetical protein SBD_1790 [Streptomyces bottropensis ATCC 25435]|uniref:Uncharacterized protein n=1 Tax=Streptomyces bottropensis ATCC 25435 TaxID=1054862 RepID=M3DIT7_9ACTN|nr:hypothetical protein SBD_1790 [Streptomyces bottropensis ATCC 25435]